MTQKLLPVQSSVTYRDFTNELQDKLHECKDISLNEQWWDQIAHDVSLHAITQDQNELARHLAHTISFQPGLAQPIRRITSQA